MTRKEIKHTGTFMAKSEEGSAFTIFEYTEYHINTTKNGANRIEGMKTLKTDDGHSVRRIEKGKYVIIDFEEIHVESDDPRAQLSQSDRTVLYTHAPRGFESRAG